MVSLTSRQREEKSNHRCFLSLDHVHLLLSALSPSLDHPVWNHVIASYILILATGAKVSCYSIMDMVT